MPNYLRTKEGVEFATIAPGGFRILAALWKAAQQLGVDLTITAGTDGVHSGPMDRHYRGEAYDVRTFDLPPGVADKLVTLLQEDLGDQFYVFLESSGPHTTAPHIHCQVAKGVIYG